MALLIGYMRLAERKVLLLIGRTSLTKYIAALILVDTAATAWAVISSTGITATT